MIKIHNLCVSDKISSRNDKRNTFSSYVSKESSIIYLSYNSCEFTGNIIVHHKIQISQITH